MNGESSASRGGSGWRDFLQRREPGARWMLLLLVLVTVAEVWMMFAFHEDDLPWPTRLQCISLTVSGLALLTLRWWSLPAVPAFPDPKWEVPPASRRWVWLMAGAIAMLAVWPRSVRLGHSLTDGEIQQIARAGATDKLITNHTAADFAADVPGQRLPNPRAAPAPAPENGRPLSERVIRTLPWAAGFLTAGLLVLLGAALGSPRAGLAAGLIIALHPGHIRWSSELADQAHMQLSLVAAMLCLLCALRTNRWRWWAALAGCEALALIGAGTGMLWLLVLNICAFAILAFSKIPERDRMSHALRMVVALGIAAVVLPVPTVLMLEGFSTPPSLADEWARAVAGVRWKISFAAEGSGFDIAGMAAASAWRGPVLWGLMPLCAAAGLGFMLWQDWRTRLVALMVVPVTLFSPGTASVFLPLLLAWAGAGLLRLFPKERRLLHAPLIIAVVYVITTTPVLQRMMQVPQQPLREAALTARRSAGESGAAASFGDGAGFAAVYDPAVKTVKSVADIDALIDTAYEKNLPLFVYRMNAAALDSEWKALQAKLTKSGQFHLVKEFGGFEPEGGYELYRYQSREQIIHFELKPEKK